MKIIARGDVNEFISVGGNSAYPCFFVKGTRRGLMIDAGINLLGPLYLTSIRQTFGSTEGLHYAFVTHSHYDHLGAIPYLKRKMPALQTGAAPRVGPLLKKASVLKTMNELSDVQRSRFKNVVGEEDVRLEPVEFDFALKEGDRFDLGGCCCEVYEVPGHTRDSLAFFVPEARALFAAEAIGVAEGDDGSIMQVEFMSSFDDYLASMKKIIALKPEIIGMAHDWVFTGDDATQFLEDSYQATFTYRDRIQSYLDAAQGDVEAAVQAMTRKEYDEKGTIRQERAAYVTNLRARMQRLATAT